MTLAVHSSDELVVLLFRQLTGEQKYGHYLNRSSRNTTIQAPKVCLLLTQCGQDLFQIPLMQKLVEDDVLGDAAFGEMAHVERIRPLFDGYVPPSQVLRTHNRFGF